jgi:hypothetical protein
LAAIIVPVILFFAMSAKVTAIIYILICFEVGILLVILPWTPYWDDNFFLNYITSKLHQHPCLLIKIGFDD